MSIHPLVDRPLVEDSESTAELPQLDMKALAAVFERMNESGEASTSRDAAPEWQRLDEFAGLRDRVAHLEALLREGEVEYARLMTRHDALQRVLSERDMGLTTSHRELQRVTEQCAAQEQQIAALHTDAQALRNRIEEVAAQRKQRDHFIVKQAQEIRRLRARVSD